MALAIVDTTIAEANAGSATTASHSITAGNAAVYVTNRDGCSYQCAPVDAKGKLKVDFVMKPLESEAYMTDRVKFHFYFRDNSDQMLKPVCAGHMALLDLADHVGSGGAVECAGGRVRDRCR